MMPAIGSRSILRVVREAPPGLYLDGGALGEILLPRRYIPQVAGPGTQLDVFIYRDSEDRLVATTETPHVGVGEFAFLKVVGTRRGVGAFLDWGLSKDLLLPLREQTRTVTEGESVVVHVFLDRRSGRIVATMRVSRHLSQTIPAYKEGERVPLLIAGETPLGFNAIVENAHSGLLYAGELSAPLEIGQRLDGYVRKVRPDGKIDLGLDPAGYRRVGPLTEEIIEALKAGGGRLDVDDNSPPEVIRAAFNTSKKAFKQALGALYRERRIRFAKPGIESVDEAPRKPARK